MNVVPRTGPALGRPHSASTASKRFPTSFGTGLDGSQPAAQTTRTPDLGAWSKAMDAVPFDGSALLLDVPRVALERRSFVCESRAPAKPRLLESVRLALRVRHYSRRTEEGLRRLDPSVRPRERQTPPGRVGRGRGHDVPLGARHRRAGKRLDAEPSARRRPLPLPRSPGAVASLARRYRAREEAATPPGRTDARGGRRSSAAARRRPPTTRAKESVRCPSI